LARKREFDPDTLVEKAMLLFWEKGYAETSVRDLVEATGVAHAGLYAAFEDKEGLYAASLMKYQGMVSEMLYAKLLEPDAGLGTVVEFFEFVLAQSKKAPFSNGCMMANTSVEFGESNERLQKLVLTNLKKLTAAFQNALVVAQEHGELASDHNVDQLAAGLAASFQGLSILARAGAPQKTITGAVSATLAQLT
jgi:TetR/AcrR family transcriptional repressor of nem operon